MINQAAEVIHSADAIKVNKKETKKLEKAASVDSVVKKKKVKSPAVSRRILPSTPSFLKSNNDNEKSKSSEDVSTKEEKTDTTISKFKYNSLPRKKKDSKSRLSSSTFYVKEEESNLSHSANASPKLKQKVLIRNDSASSNHTNHTKESEAHFDKQTHVALYKFYARHKDELAFIDGDPIQVTKIFDDLWYEGVNLATGKQGLFPCRYVADIMAYDLPSNSIQNDVSDHQQFHLRFLGSVEVADHKGDEVLCFAIAKVVNQRSLLSTSTPPSCVLQVNSMGIRICNLDNALPHQQDADRKSKKGKQVETTDLEEDNSHYFSLKNVTFCGNHPKDRRYFGFITKHPDEHRFACHIFMSKYSTDQLAKVIGDCFKKFYETYMEYRAPTEEFYLE